MIRAIVFLSLMLGTACPVAAIELVGVDEFNDTLVAIDPTNAATTPLGPVGDPIIGSLAYDPNHRILYAASTTSLNLLTINPVDGTTSVVGYTGVELIHALEYDSNADVLYAVSSEADTLYRIDVMSAAATPIGPTGINRVGAMAFDPVSDVMYATDISPASGSSGLFTVDLATGQLNFVAGFNNPEVVQIAGLAFHPDFGLLGADNKQGAFTADHLFSIDPLTGQATSIGDLGINTNFLGIAFVEQIPEPTSALFVFQSGLAVVLLGRPYRRL